MKSEKKIYETSASFIPQSLNDICMDFIINYCVANNEVDWLKNLASKKETARHKGNNGNIILTEQKISFITIRKNFVEKFFPQIKAQKKTTISFYDKIANL